MEKTKYRYKCMICGTEVVSADDVLSCSACGSDELVKFEIAPVIDGVEKKPPRKQPRRRKPVLSLTSDVDILSIIKDLDSKPSMPTSCSPSDPDVLPIARDRDPAPPMPKVIPPYRRPSIHISPPAPPPPPTKWDRIRGFMAKVPWQVMLRIAAPLAIGGVIYGIVKLFI